MCTHQKQGCHQQTLNEILRNLNYIVKQEKRMLIAET